MAVNSYGLPGLFFSSDFWKNDTQNASKKERKVTYGSILNLSFPNQTWLFSWCMRRASLCWREKCQDVSVSKCYWSSKRKKKMLRPFSLKYRGFLFKDKSQHGDCYAFCKVCRCNINIWWYWGWNAEVPTPPNLLYFLQMLGRTTDLWSSQKYYSHFFPHGARLLRLATLSHKTQHDQLRASEKAQPSGSVLVLFRKQSTSPGAETITLYLNSADVTSAVRSAGTRMG